MTDPGITHRQDPFPTHGSLNFSAPDRLELARRHDEFQAACVAFFRYHDDIPTEELRRIVALNDGTCEFYAALLRARLAMEALGC